MNKQKTSAIDFIYLYQSCNWFWTGPAQTVFFQNLSVLFSSVHVHGFISLIQVYFTL